MCEILGSDGSEYEDSLLRYDTTLVLRLKLPPSSPLMMEAA